MSCSTWTPQAHTQISCCVRGLWVKICLAWKGQPCSGYSAWPCLPVIASLPACPSCPGSSLSLCFITMLAVLSPRQGLLQVLSTEVFSLCVSAHPYQYLSVCTFAVDGIPSSVSYNPCFFFGLHPVSSSCVPQHPILSMHGTTIASAPTLACTETR